MQPKTPLITATCAGLFGAILMSAPAGAAPAGPTWAGGPGLGAGSLTEGPSLTTPARYMRGRSISNGKHPSRPKGQKRRGSTSGGPRY